MSNLRAGKKPRKGKKEDLPKPTELMKRRETSLELEKNLNKTMVVQVSSGRGPGVPGFFCEACNRTYKDSAGYLDHVNSRARKCLCLCSYSLLRLTVSLTLPDLAKLGQTTKIERSTLEQVRSRIAYLREKTKEQTTAKEYDFEKRLAEVKAKEAAVRAEKKAAVKAKKEKARIELMKDVDMKEVDDMSAMMGFSGFGGSKK
jgi:U4/U6.U5 tri-snRNP component SNU23